jgi:hypothetical protein
MDESEDLQINALLFRHLWLVVRLRGEDLPRIALKSTSRRSASERG